MTLYDRIRRFADGDMSQETSVSMSGVCQCACMSVRMSGVCQCVNECVCQRGQQTKNQCIPNTYLSRVPQSYHKQ